MKKPIVVAALTLVLTALPAFAQVADPHFNGVPDVGATAGLLGLGLLAVGVLRRMVKT